MADLYEYSTPELVRLLGSRFKEYRMRCNNWWKKHEVHYPQGNTRTWWHCEDRSGKHDGWKKEGTCLPLFSSKNWRWKVVDLPQISIILTRLNQLCKCSCWNIILWVTFLVSIENQHRNNCSGCCLDWQRSAQQQFPGLSW